MMLPLPVIFAVIGLIIAVEGRIADRSRVVKARKASGRYDSNRDNGRAIEGPAYRKEKNWDPEILQAEKEKFERKKKEEAREAALLGIPDLTVKDAWIPEVSSEEGRKLGSQLTGCCTNYQNYYAADMCGYYGQDCESSGGGSGGGSQDEDCAQSGLAFIGVSFSVNTANGNPYSYQLCDQFPMENIIDRSYTYIMSMDEDGWLVGGGYKTFDYSGKMPYIDSSHTELLRIGSIDPDKGGTSISQVYNAMENVGFPPLWIFPEYLKGGGGHNSNDNGDDDESVPSGDVTLVVSVVDVYEDDDSYSGYEVFLDNLFSAMYNVGAGPCMDDQDTDPHVSMSRGVKFKSSYHQQQYMYNANLEVAVWQAMYPYGVVIGADGYAAFPPGINAGRRQYVGYGNLYFFFDRANITKAFAPNRDLTDDESYYATLYKSSDVSGFYSDTTEIPFDYSGSQDGGDDDAAGWEHNPYAWKATMAMHDMTDGWDLPPNCNQEGETFFGIPLSRKSESKLQSTSSFQEQFDFEVLVDRNFTYISGFGTNHGWLVGEAVDNGGAFIVDKDTAHIPIFYTGTTNVEMGGMSLSDMIRIAKHIDFGTLYIKPAFVFVDDNGHVKLQFEADSNSALAYLYDSLCAELGIAWNYESPSNDLGVYTNCAMHAAGDRASYGCGPDNSNSGGFCPQMTLAYSVRFQSDDHALEYLTNCNNYVDYWRSLYPSGVAVGTNSFCPNGGCLGLFLNRFDLYTVFKPDLGGSWVEYNGHSRAPTYSPAPTYVGGCSEPRNFHLDMCFSKRHKPRTTAAIWNSIGPIGQLSIFLVSLMAITLSVSVFLARARKRKRKGESYFAFFFRDMNRKKKKKKKVRRKVGDGELEEDMLPNGSKSGKRSRSRAGSRSRNGDRPRSRSRSSRSRSGRSSSRAKGTLRTADVPADDGENLKAQKSQIV